jgi:hypothetical protein
MVKLTQVMQTNTSFCNNSSIFKGNWTNRYYQADKPVFHEVSSKTARVTRVIERIQQNNCTRILIVGLIMLFVIAGSAKSYI